MKRYIFYFIPILIFTSCYDENDYDIRNIDPDEVILKIEIENETILADGVSSSKITVEIPSEADETRSSVRIKASNGKFKENNDKEIAKDAKMVSSDGTTRRMAEFILISSTIAETSELEILVGEFKKNRSIQFSNKYPDYIKSTPSKLFINPNNGEEINIVCKISCENGLPSLGQEIDLLVTDSVFKKNGTFRVYDNLSDSSNETNYVYTQFPDTTYFGRLYLISLIDVEANILSDTILSDTVIIYAKNY